MPVFKHNRTGECYDYMFGFCINGPYCKYRHTKKPQSDMKEMPKIPEWYLSKIKGLFGNDLVYFLTKSQGTYTQRNKFNPMIFNQQSQYSQKSGYQFDRESQMSGY